jgi:predicted esterase
MDRIIEQMMDDGFPSRKIALLGFSQGACLVSEYAARHPRVYGGVMALTGGLIGPPLPPGTPRDYAGSLAGTPVFLGSSDPDPHVPFSRVQETRQVLEQMGAQVDLRRYPGMPHIVNEEEISACRAILEKIGKEQE